MLKMKLIYLVVTAQLFSLISVAARCTNKDSSLFSQVVFSFLSWQFAFDKVSQFCCKELGS